MLRSISITKAFALVAGAAALLLCVAVGLALMQVRSIMLDQKRAEIRNTVDAAATIVKGAFDTAKAGGANDGEALKQAANVLRSSRFDNGNYLYIYDLDGNTLMHPIRKDLEGKNNLGLKDKNGLLIIQEFVREVKEKGAGFTDYYWKKPGQDVETLKIAYNALIPGARAFVGSGLHVDDVDAALWREAGLLAAKLLPLMLAFTLLALGLGRNAAQALRRLTGSVEAVAAGSLDEAIHDTGRKDEIGIVARALQVFREALVAKREADAAAETGRAREGARRRAVDDAIAGFEAKADTVVLTISSTANELEASANELARSAQNTTGEASTVAAAATQTSTTIQGLAAAGEELSGSAREIARLIEESSHAAAAAVTSMKGTEHSAQALLDAAAQIGSVVSLINGLAEQTNLLALNATIEAARAGEAGKGFAVVANEVKALAGQTTKATAEIATMIAAIREASDQTVAAIGEIGNAIELIDRAAGEIAGSVAEQERATGEIAANVQQAATGTEDVSRAITQVSQTAGDTTSAAHQVHGAAGDLARQAETMRLEVQRFLEAVRAA